MLTGKSRETINNATQDGTLSYSLNGRNHKVIDISELERIYPLVKTMDEIEKKEIVKKSPVPSETDSQEWRNRYVETKSRLESAEEKIQLIEKYHTKERNIFEDQVENLQKSLFLAQEGHNRATLLLEDKSEKQGEWQTAVSSLKEQISNDELAATERLGLITKEKNDLAKANIVYAVVSLICITSLVLFALVQSGIIQIN